MAFLTLFLIPAFVALGFLMFGGSRITLKEFLVQLGIQAVVAGVSAITIYNLNTTDKEIWNGRVVQKFSQRVSCEHSYPCNCTQSCDSNNSCTTTCQTCYDHDYDIDWVVKTSNDEKIKIHRVDRQGVNEPPRWTAVVIGEPTAVEHSYTNFIKAAPDTLFKDAAQREPAGLAYPGNVYDYYRLDRVVTAGASVPDLAAWNKDLTEVNADLGAKKQVNIVLVLASGKSKEWFYRLQKDWVGGKKNQVTVVINTALDSDRIEWVDVLAWTYNSMVRVETRDDILAVGSLDRTKIMEILRRDIDAGFERKHMKDFAYLKSSVTPTSGQLTVSLIIGLIFAVGVGWYLYENDVFNEERRKWAR